MSYFVYILECADTSLYVGSTNDLQKRLKEHNGSKNGAHYTKIRRPVVLRYSEELTTYGESRSREAEIKRMKRKEKLDLINTKGVRKNDAFTHPVILLLDNVRSVQNVASLFRIADCVGVQKIVLGGITPGPVDRFNRPRKDFAKISLGAEKSVGWESIENILATIKKYKKEGYAIVALEQSVKSISYTKYKITQPTLIVVGTEVEGVSKEVLKLCETHLEIPMAGKKESLNVAVATSVLLFSLRDAT